MAMTYAATNRNPIIRGKSIGPVVRQEDIDTLRFGVVATVDNGKYSNVAVVIVQCSECKKLTFYGQLPAALNMFAIGIEDYYSGSATQPTLPTDGNEAAVELEDIESGDIAPVPDVLKPLLKKANGPGELHDSPSSSPTNELNRT